MQIPAANPVLNVLKRLPSYESLFGDLRIGAGPLAVFGVGEGAKPHLVAALVRDLDKAALLVAATESSAARMQEDLSGYLENVLHFPAREMPLSGSAVTASSGLAARRLNVLMRLARGEKVLVIAPVEALLQRLAPPEALIGAQFELVTGECYSLSDLARSLANAGYERVEQCEGKGQFSLRGGILDIFPITSARPCRIEFFDDEIDTIREYDADTQRSIDRIDSILVPPAGEIPLTEEARARGIKALNKCANGCEFELEALKAGGTPAGIERILPLFYPGETALADYFAQGSPVFVDEPPRVEESAMVAFSNFTEAAAALISRGEGQGAEGALYNSPKETIEGLSGTRTVLLYTLARQTGLIRPKEIHRMDVRSAPQYLSGIENLATDIKSWKRGGSTVILYAGSHAQRIADELGNHGIDVPISQALSRDFQKGELLILSESLPRGFEYPELRFIVITEQELYGNTRKKRAQQKKRPQLAFSELNVGDLVVHEAHGIGKFVGVEALTVEDNTRDYLLIQYAAGDKLYIPTDQLDRVQKYIGADDKEPRLSKLGGGEWQKAVSRTREGVKALAFDLVKLYSERENTPGFAFSEDTPWQRQLEERFPFEETPDQLTSIAEIKKDMESSKVMDRLLCGDVGYGKTEVALRAAFKAVMDSKQVAFLVPTTILAQQHYNTLKSRFAGFPINIELLSRFKNAAEQKEILKKLESGQVDVLVGTHKLLGKDVRFHDLGLLIVDEEQRFGVGHKEKIKDIKKSVDVLTLTATPIPRTLHMSMTGIRDMSVIETPPEQRYPVQTYVMEYSDAVVREAIMKELGRGGQAYIVYNKVRDMEQYAGRLSQLIPEARITFAHGQMSERLLEKTMLEFMDGQYDVLLCSTIIESGVDIPNVNTIIVCDADHLGLSQLYQIRGRVGRSTRLGYAYLTFQRNKVLTEVAEKRLTAIREFTQFGSGFRIAMRDLEIRGAGNLLGPEQHGHMAEVGYDFYCKLMADAVREARGEPAPLTVETTVELPVDAHIPHGYIPGEARRLSMYKRIASIGSREEMYDVQEELEDRYGDIPTPVQNLMDVAVIKAVAEKAYITKLTLKAGEVRCSFHPDAPILGEKLFALCERTEGAQILAGPAPVLRVTRNKTGVPELFRSLPQFVYTILDCIDTGK